MEAFISKDNYKFLYEISFTTTLWQVNTVIMGRQTSLGQCKRNDVIITAMLLFDHFDDHQWLWKSNPHPELTNEIVTCGKGQ